MNKDRFALLLATCGGVGYLPVGPGTAGSLVGAAIAWVFVQATGAPAWSLIVAAAVLLPVAAWASGHAENTSGRHDPGFVVIDEVVGQWIALGAARPGRWEDWLAAIVLFRFFDIVKPPPIRSFERLPGGWGVAADDAAAGACAMMIFAASLWLLGAG